MNESTVEFAWGLLHLYLTDAAGDLRESARLTVPPRFDRNLGPTLRKSTLVFDGPCWRPDNSEKGYGRHSSYGMVLRVKAPFTQGNDTPLPLVQMLPVTTDPLRSDCTTTTAFAEDFKRNVTAKLRKHFLGRDHHCAAGKCNCLAKSPRKCQGGGRGSTMAPVCIPGHL